MNAILKVLTVAVILVVPGTSFALWGIVVVTKDSAQELGLEIRSTPAGPDAVRIELSYKTEGKLKGVSRVDLQVGQGDNPTATASLKEDHSKEGQIVVGFAASRADLDKLSLRVMVPGSLGGTVYIIRVKDFVEAK